MVNPEFLCRRHLLGEHLEVHMFVGAIKSAINRGRKIEDSLRGYIENGLVETDKLFDRHENLVIEMLSRGFRHSSPIEKLDSDFDSSLGRVDVSASIVELIRRCQDCHKRIRRYGEFESSTKRDRKERSKLNEWKRRC